LEEAVDLSSDRLLMNESIHPFKANGYYMYHLTKHTELCTFSVWFNYTLSVSLRIKDSIWSLRGMNSTVK
jgi:hypothetical protein